MIEKDSLEDRAFGCMLGGFIGDTSGLWCEGTPHVLPEEDMDITMRDTGRDNSDGKFIKSGIY